MVQFSKNTRVLNKNDSKYSLNLQIIFNGVLRWRQTTAATIDVNNNKNNGNSSGSSKRKTSIYIMSFFCSHLSMINIILKSVLLLYSARTKKKVSQTYTIFYRIFASAAPFYCQYIVCVCGFFSLSAMQNSNKFFQQYISSHRPFRIPRQQMRFSFATCSIIKISLKYMAKVFLLRFSLLLLFFFLPLQVVENKSAHHFMHTRSIFGSLIKYDSVWNFLFCICQCETSANSPGGVSSNILFVLWTCVALVILSASIHISNIHKHMIHDNQFNAIK